MAKKPTDTPPADDGDALNADPATESNYDLYGQVAQALGIDPANMLVCRTYPDSGRIVVVTVDGRKLQTTQAEVDDHAA
ncbi:MAG: hypothetical protein PHR16_11785 [Methylovulum sp.]|nr:hypothetical protein [Methylovulum sp.]